MERDTPQQNDNVNKRPDETNMVAPRLRASIHDNCIFDMRKRIKTHFEDIFKCVEGLCIIRPHNNANIHHCLGFSRIKGTRNCMQLWSLMRLYGNDMTCIGLIPEEKSSDEKSTKVSTKESAKKSTKVTSTKVSTNVSAKKSAKKSTNVTSTTVTSNNDASDIKKKSAVIACGSSLNSKNYDETNHFGLYVSSMFYRKEITYGSAVYLLREETQIIFEQICCIIHQFLSIYGSHYQAEIARELNCKFSVDGKNQDDTIAYALNRMSELKILRKIAKGDPDDKIGDDYVHPTVEDNRQKMFHINKSMYSYSPPDPLMIIKRMSSYEYQAFLKLEELGIAYISQATFQDCRNDKTGKLLRFDFLIFGKNDKKLLLEIDGQQHDGFVEHFHRDMEGYHNACRRDKIKEIYAYNNNFLFEVIKHREPIKQRIQEILAKYDMI